jgi:hypothetical protein
VQRSQPIALHLRRLLHSVLGRRPQLRRRVHSPDEVLARLGDRDQQHKDYDQDVKRQAQRPHRVGQRPCSRCQHKSHLTSLRPGACSATAAVNSRLKLIGRSDEAPCSSWGGLLHGDPACTGAYTLITPRGLCT